MSLATPLYSSLGGDPDLRELVELFVAEMPERISLLSLHFESANWEELRRASHQLKGAAGSYGFHDLTPAAASLEAAIKRRDPEQRIAAELGALLELCHSVRAGAAG